MSDWNIFFFCSRSFQARAVTYLIFKEIYIFDLASRATLSLWVLGSSSKVINI